MCRSAYPCHSRGGCGAPLFCCASVAANTPASRNGSKLPAMRKLGTRDDGLWLREPMDLTAKTLENGALNVAAVGRPKNSSGINPTDPIDRWPSPGGESAGVGAA